MSSQVQQIETSLGERSARIRKGEEEGGQEGEVHASKTRRFSSHNKDNSILCGQYTGEQLHIVITLAIDCRVFDGAVIVHSLPVSGVSTFDDYAGNVLILYIGNQSSKRVDIVCDLKESTREKRGKGVRRKVSGSVKITSKWMQFLRDSVNKKELIAFLSA